ncbi:unnamed protein product, partial [Ixodes persulcatus]
MKECWDEVERKQRREEAERRMMEAKLQKPSDEARKVETLDIKAFLQPFRVGGDPGLFLINFERTCTKLGLADSDWAQRLLSVLPGEAADVVARLDPDTAQDYFKVKESLLKKFKLSPEAFRVKFREATKHPEESYSEFAYRLQGFLENWLRGV